MKRVSFKVAKALREAGYSQECDMYYSVPPKFQDIGRKIAQPTYMEVWLWLWREKHIALEVFAICNDKWTSPIDILLKYPEYDDPEEAIIAAIEELIHNNLVK